MKQTNQPTALAATDVTKFTVALKIVLPVNTGIDTLLGVPALSWIQGSSGCTPQVTPGEQKQYAGPWGSTNELLVLPSLQNRRLSSRAYLGGVLA
ncbi:hypothetical protein J6590_015808 [Homalodisca vitripennis]|nr:hypothetical protein J6590_015808 [Homalodisca vitripennis]